MMKNKNSLSSFAIFAGRTIITLLPVLTMMFGNYALANIGDLGQGGASQGMQQIHQWLSQWVPILCTISLVVVGIAWGILHMLPASVGIKAIVGLIVAGCASWVVSLFLGSAGS